MEQTVDAKIIKVLCGYKDASPKTFEFITQLQPKIKQEQNDTMEELKKGLPEVKQDVDYDTEQVKKLAVPIHVPSAKENMGKDNIGKLKSDASIAKEKLKKKKSFI